MAFEDPAEFEGTDEEKLNKFREVRDQIEAGLLSWLWSLEAKEAEAVRN